MSAHTATPHAATGQGTRERERAARREQTIALLAALVLALVCNKLGAGEGLQLLLVAIAAGIGLRLAITAERHGG